MKLYFSDLLSAVERAGLDPALLDRFDDWLGGHPKGARDCITVLAAEEDLKLHTDQVLPYFIAAMEAGILVVEFYALCPDCRAVVKKVRDINELPDPHAEITCPNGHTYTPSSPDYPLSPRPECCGTAFAMVKGPDRWVRKRQGAEDRLMEAPGEDA